MRRRTIASLLTAVLAGAGTLAPAAPASSAEDEPLRYVAMGDSYSAASGVLPVDPAAPPQCLRSTANFANVIAARTGAALTDVTCGGAQTKDYFESQHPGVAPQLDALRRGTELVTMTIGGNDNNTFISAIAQCGVAGATTPGPITNDAGPARRLGNGVTTARSWISCG